MTYDVELKKDLFRGIRLRSGVMLVMEELLAMKVLSVVTFGLASCYRNVHVSTTMGERGKGVFSYQCTAPFLL